MLYTRIAKPSKYGALSSCSCWHPCGTDSDVLLFHCLLTNGIIASRFGQKHLLNAPNVNVGQIRKTIFNLSWHAGKTIYSVNKHTQEERWASHSWVDVERKHVLTLTLTSIYGKTPRLRLTMAWRGVVVFTKSSNYCLKNIVYSCLFPSSCNLQNSR